MDLALDGQVPASREVYMKRCVEIEEADLCQLARRGGSRLASCGPPGKWFTGRRSGPVLAMPDPRARLFPGVAYCNAIATAIASRGHSSPEHAMPAFPGVAGLEVIFGVHTRSDGSTTLAVT